MRIDVWSDVVCPWCYIGKRQLDRAIEMFTAASDVEVEVVFRSFELDPNGPRRREGEYVARLAKKYGTDRDGAQAMIDRMVSAGAGAGVELRFDIAQPGNSFDAHRVLHLARDLGRQVEVKERLLRAVFTEGEPIGDPHAVARLAVDAGLPEDRVVEVLSSGEYGLEVRQDEVEAAELGITGVPFMVVDRSYAIRGAQPAEAILSALQQARSAA
ncbi:MAG: DsbA family oxidoreductase [Acidimicrobiia bacterium]